MPRMALRLGAALLALSGSGAANAAPALFVANTAGNTIGEYTTTGAPVNPALISGLGLPEDIAVSGSDLSQTASTARSGSTPPRGQW